jgi:hypothetical protein
MKYLFAIMTLACAALALPARAETAALPVIFEMADGSFYHPSSGFKAESRDALLKRITNGDQVVASVAVADPPPVIAPVANIGLKDAVLRGRQMLQDRLATVKPNTGKVVASYDVWVDVTLAVWNSRLDEISLVEAKKNGSKIQVETEGAEVAVKKSNGVNSEFTLDDSGENFVVAVIYPIFKEITVKKKKRYELQDVVYTPYSKQLHQPEVVAWGKETLDVMVASAYDDLRARNVPSRAVPGQLLADVIDPALVKSIIIIEHVSAAAVLSGDPLRAAESVFVILATNQRDSYAYSRSSAGARGLVQFIPSTYKLIARRLDLALKPDFEAGMTDPTNAIKAEIGYLDGELAGMPIAVRDLHAADQAKAGEYLAAAYNGGGGRVRKAIKAWGEAWWEYQAGNIQPWRTEHKKLDDKVAGLKAKIKKTSDAAKLKTLKAELKQAEREHDAVVAKIETAKVASLRLETVDYVRKLRSVMPLAMVQ